MVSALLLTLVAASWQPRAVSATRSATARGSLVAAAGAVPQNENSDRLNVQWSAFKTAYGRTYTSDPSLEARRFTIFTKNLVVIEAANRNDDRAVYGVGPFADLSPVEFMSTRTSPSPPPMSLQSIREAGYLGEHTARDSAGEMSELLPAELDWVPKGAVSYVKDQKCGNCWTFSAAGSLEGAHQIATGVMTNYSEQEFVDCCDTGCKGGWNFNAIKFAVNNTLCTLEAFPNLAPEFEGNGTECDLYESSPCVKAAGALVKGSLSGWKSVGPAGGKWGSTTEEDLMSALQLGPVSINMFADSHMGHYKGGVLSYSNCTEGTNHGVLAVGYGTCEADPAVVTGPCANTTAKIDYWKVKNSWGTQFGVDGYFYLARGVYAAGCGPASILLTNPSYPVMAEHTKTK